MFPHNSKESNSILLFVRLSLFKEVGLLQVRVNLGVMAMKEYQSSRTRASSSDAI